MKKILLLLLTSLTLLSSCGGGSENLSESFESINESESVSEEIPSMAIQTFTGGFIVNENEVVTTKTNNLSLITNREFVNGTLKMSVLNNGYYSAGIIFKAEAYPSSYYYLNISSNNGNQMSLIKNVNGNDTVLKSCYITAGYNSKATVNLKIIFNNGDIKCFFEDKLYIYVKDESPLNGDRFGFRSHNKDTLFTNIEFNEDITFNTVDTLIIGHSYMELWANYKNDLSRYSDIYNIGIGGTVASDWMGHYEEILAYHPNRLIYMIGINDVPRDLTASNIVTNIRNLVDRLLVGLPNVEICLVSINQCNTHLDFRGKIINCNTLIRQYVNANERLYYGDVDNAFLNSSNLPDPKYFVDGLHPTEEAYKIIAQAIYDAFDGVNTPIENNRTTLIIGHSYMGLWKDQCISDLSHYPNVVNIGVGGTQGLYWATRIDEIVSYNPKKLIYMTGINDVPHGIENRTLYTHLYKTVFEVKERIEDIEICLLSIPQVPMFYDQYKDKVTEANNYYKKLAYDFEHVYYGDVDDAYLRSDGTPDPNCFTDGLHPKMEEYDVIVKAIDEAFNNQNQPTKEEIYVEIDNVDYNEASGETLVNELKNNCSTNWGFDKNTINVNSKGLVLSNTSYNDFEIVYKVDKLTANNPYFSNKVQNAIIFGANVINGKLQGYALSLGSEWIQICYLDGSENYKVSFLNGYNISSAYAYIKLSVINSVASLTYGDGDRIGNSFTGALSFPLLRYQAGSVGVLKDEEGQVNLEIKQMNSFEDKDNQIGSLLSDLSNNNSTDFVIDSNNRTITTSVNDGIILSSDEYLNFNLSMSIDITNAENPFFEPHLCKEAILIGGEVVNGNYKGYAIHFDNSTWIEVLYLDGTSENTSTFIDGWNIPFLNKGLVFDLQNEVLTLTFQDGTSVPNTFNNVSSISLENYMGGKIGLLSFDKSPSKYTFNSFKLY